MKSMIVLEFILMSVIMFSCQRTQFADLVLKNGRIITIDKKNPRARAVAVKENIIIAVGSDSEMERYIQQGKTEVIDLEGRMVVPGFNDAHIHFTGAGERLMNVNLRGITSYEEMQDEIAERVKEMQPGEWIEGGGWDHTLIPGNPWPTKEILDEVAPDNPVQLLRIDNHSCLINSYVLKESGITKDTPDPDGGTIVKDPKTGEPTGVLKENARGLIKRAPLSPEERAKSKRRAIKLAMEEARKLGVTSIHHLMGNGEYFEEFENNGELTVRVYLCQPMTDDPERLARYKELKEKYKNDPLIKFGALKTYIDGTLGSGTAALFEPFSDDPGTSGLLMMPEEEFTHLIINADKEGFQIAVHAIGTRGNHITLNAFEKAIEENGKRDSRHKIEHSQVLIREDVPRFAELGVIASMQPTHCITDKRFAEKRLGLERCRYAYAWKSIIETGGHIAFGTDCPVEPMNPMEGLYAAVTRKDRAGEPGEGWIPEEKISMEKAIELYTLGSAYASFEEDIKGSIEVGKLADMVVLSQNLMEIPENKIMDTKVTYTIFNGKVIYENK